MLRNYLKIALRNLRRNKVYSALNIAGLALGMAVAILIGLWIVDEFNANKNFDHYDKIVQLVQNGTRDGHAFTDHFVPVPLVNQLRKDSSEFTSVAMMSITGGHMLGFKDKNFGTEGCRYAESGIIDLLPIKMISGGPNSLDATASVIIDQWLAKNLFGNEDPLYKLIRVDNKQIIRVTGVFQDFPQGSAFGPGSVFQQVHLIASWAQYVAENPDIRKAEGSWDNNPFMAYARLADHADINIVSARIRQLMDGHGRTDHPEVMLYPMDK
jgi:hypothetical protein